MGKLVWILHKTASFTPLCVSLGLQKEADPAGSQPAGSLFPMSGTEHAAWANLAFRTASSDAGKRGSSPLPAHKCTIFSSLAGKKGKSVSRCARISDAFSDYNSHRPVLLQEKDDGICSPTASEGGVLR